MIDFVFGKKSNPKATNELVASLEDLRSTGTLYIGYPVFDVDDESLLTDALLITKENGVVVFDLTTSHESNFEKIIEYQDDLYRGLYKKFLSEKKLVKKRNLTFQVEVLSLRLNDDKVDGADCTTPNELVGDLSQFEGINDEQFQVINAAIQKTGVLKPQKKRTKVHSDDSFGAVIKSIEKEIANLDRWQKKAAIESPDKPQRVRGLAGCGKTIILCMKAAYLHAYSPDLKVVVTFQTRSLYQQIRKLIERFYFDHKRDEPDFECLKILHAWGSRSEVGIYSECCSSLGIEPLSFFSAKQKYGQELAFEGACKEALEVAKSCEVVPTYDYILIDEAQDFPASFFQLVYKFVKQPKRVVWAYDELQNLGEFSMLPPAELFGKSPQGTALVTLENENRKPQQDIMLPICYRNPPWTLTLALALGLGIYREDGFVRMFPDPNFWKNIGYEVKGGNLALSKKVRLQRSSDRTPNYFNDLIDPTTAIIYQGFQEKEEQARWVAEQIKENITRDELDLSDILVVFPDAYTLNSESAYLIYELRERGINCHIAGKDTSRDIVFMDNSIAIAHIYRAKGNEAPMVYVMNANYCYAGFDLGKKRNSLFTAITRAKAWVRITGYGDNMGLLINEIEKVFNSSFILDFKYPSKLEMKALANAYKDKSDSEKKEIHDGFGKIKQIRNMLKKGTISIEDVPEDLRSFFTGK